jgi:hypothetical protein
LLLANARSLPRAGIEFLKADLGGDAGSPLGVQAVRLLPSDALAAGLDDAHVAGIAYDARADILHLLFDRAQPAVLRTFHLGSGKLIGDAQLPPAPPSAITLQIWSNGVAPLTWSGLALSPDGGALYALRASPPQLWRFARRADGTLACGDDVLIT